MARWNGYAMRSKCGLYRYELGGDIGPAEPLLAIARAVRMILWIMLNPSTADASEDDPTLRTITAFSEIWGYNRLMVGNLYAYRTPFPREMFRAAKAGVDVVGPENNTFLTQMVERVRASGGRVMAAWGGNAKIARVQEVASLVGEMHCLRTNSDGSPVHPLFQPHTLVPVPWRIAA
jgi:hypothetical protein